MFGEQALTYRELNRRANQLAHHLRALGVGPDLLIGVCVERSLEMVIALLGILKAGGAYVPLDPEYPKDRLAFMIQDADAPVLLTQNHLVANLPTHKAKAICLDTDWGKMAKESPDNPSCITRPDQLAYMIYTSGSTGKPKGAKNHHRGICNRLLWMQDEYRLSSADTVMQKTPFSFDVSVWEFFWPLMTGARLVVARPGGHRDPAYLVDLIEQQGITVLHFVPSMLQIFVEERGLGRCGSLRHVMCSGEALPYELQEKFFSRLSAELHNLYGPTEAAVDVTYWKCQRGSDLRIVPIGRPVANTQCYVLDPALKPVPVGEVGELHLGGVQVGYGYHNRPELTAEKFIADPFRGEPGARLYKTGDLARYLPDGAIEYLGRIDDQVKIRGFRIELGEIESRLRQHTGISDCAVVAREDHGGQKRLVAYLVPFDKAAVSVQELRTFVQQKLPEYMIPAAFVTLDALPLSPNGKLDRKALPVPVQSRPELANPYLAPRVSEEMLLADIWSEVLQVQPVGVRDNYFELGGDSIRVIQMLARARHKGMHLTLEQVYKEQTIEKLVPFLRPISIDSAQTPGTQPFELVTAEDRAKLPQELDDAYPLSALQEGMHFHSNLNPASAIFHDIFSYKIFAAFDQAKLESALEQLVARHPSLRASYDFAGYSEPLQLVHKKVRAPFTVQNLSHLAPAEQLEALVAWFEIEKRRPFMWEEAPLVRFHAQRYGERQFQFVVSIHHMIFDGWSLAAFVTELFQDYFSMLAGARRAVPPLRANYRDFVALERRAARSEEHRRFWSDRLANATRSRAPRWPASMCKGGLEQVRGPEIIVPAKVLEGLKQMAQATGVPLRTVLHAAHMKVMSVVYGTSDVLSGVLTNGRQEELDTEQVVGLFLNSAPFRMQLPGGSWMDLCRQTFEAEQEMIPYRRLPLIEAHKLAGGQTLFEVLFDFVNFHVFRGLEGYPNCRLERGHYFEANDIPLGAYFLLDTNSTELEFHFDYLPDQFPEEQIRELSGYYLNTVVAMVADPTARYELFSPLSETEKKKLTVEWNRTTREFEKDATLHWLIEQQVARSPDAVAVAFEDKHLTYRELNQRANRLAHYLRHLGVGPDVLVGIHVDRSLEMLVGLLGILKAGGAYVPLDPSYPKDRLAFMLGDARAPVLLTQKRLVESLTAQGTRAVCLDSDWDEIARYGQQDPERRSTAESLAYVIYTSGSTGKPKGVEVPNRAVVNFLRSMQREPGLDQHDVLLAVTPLSFDIAGLELFLPLLVGARIELVSREIAVDGTRLLEKISDSRATTLQATPSTLRLLLEAGWQAGSQLKILCGGEPLPRELADQLLTRSISLWNMYGPTETTIWSSTDKVQQGVGPVPIGRPIANTQLYILDPHLQPVPVGVPGELHIGGVGVARGYLDQPKLTAEKFTRNPFASQTDARLYKTGDLARHLLDGRIEFLGRNDFQVKVRGFRIELGEIESRLAQHPAIREAVVVAREDSPGDKRLVAYYTVAKTAESTASTVDAEALRKHLSSVLPDHMVPAAYVALDALPHTPNGKLDRKALPTPEGTAYAARTYEAPDGEIEIKLAQIWADVLKVERVGRQDNFFELGGHSLLAIRVVSRVRQTLSVELPLRDLFAAPTIAGLAAQIEAFRAASGLAHGRETVSL
ncbi:MAG: amino acid adenylation domain-containing protein [Burkholderiales bacterium]